MVRQASSSVVSASRGMALLVDAELAQPARHADVVGELADVLGEQLGGLVAGHPVDRQPGRPGQLDEPLGARLRVVADDVRQQHAVDHAVRRVEQAADLVAHRVGGAEDRVGERQARLEAGLRHLGAGAPPRVGSVIVVRRWWQTSPTALRAWMSASGLWASETNASMPWVSASRPVAALSHSGIVISSRGSVIEMSGHQRPAHDGDLHERVGVGDDAELRDVGAGARGARDHQQRRDRLGDAVDAGVVEDPAAVAATGSRRPWRRRCRSRRRCAIRTSQPCSTYRSYAAWISWSLGFGVTSDQTTGSSRALPQEAERARRPSRPR